MSNAMGTNYYHIKNVCEHCGRGDDPVHIGKSSAGWCFALHVYPGGGPEDLEQWKATWSEGMIEDEYGDKVSPEAMLQLITERRWKHCEEQRKFPMYRDEDHFHRSNHSERGPNGLSRHKLMPGLCIGHGEGTWDLMIGDFS